MACEGGGFFSFIYLLWMGLIQGWHTTISNFSLNFRSQRFHQHFRGHSKFKSVTNMGQNIVLPQFMLYSKFFVGSLNLLVPLQLFQQKLLLRHEFHVFSLSLLQLPLEPGIFFLQKGCPQCNLVLFEASSFTATTSSNVVLFPLLPIFIVLAILRNKRLKNKDSSDEISTAMIFI